MREVEGAEAGGTKGAGVDEGTEFASAAVAAAARREE